MHTREQTSASKTTALAQKVVYLCWRVETRAFSRHIFVSVGLCKSLTGKYNQEWVYPTKSPIKSLRYSNLNVSCEQLPLQAHAEKQALLLPTTSLNPCLCDDKLLSPKGPLLLIKCVVSILQQFVLFKGWIFLCFLPSFSLEIQKIFWR